MRARVEQRVYVGSETHYELRSASQSLRVEAMNAFPEARELAPGDEVVVELPPGALVILDD